MSPKAGASSASCATRTSTRIDLASGAERPLTTEGKGTVTCGTAEFVAQEEMDRRTGTWWAPGDSRVAVECFDEAKVAVVTRAAIGANGTKTFDQRYPAAGTPNVAVTLWLMNPDGSGRAKVDLGSNPDIYLARVDWSKDGRTLYRPAPEPRPEAARPARGRSGDGREPAGAQRKRRRPGSTSTTISVR